MGRKVTRLIALDFDGTSALYEPRMSLHPAVLDILSEVLRDGCGWVLNSDRSSGMLVEIACGLPVRLRPEALLSAQRFIHIRSADGTYEPLQPWNESRMELHRSLWREIESRFGLWQSEIEADFPVLDRVVNDQVFAYMVPAVENARLRERMADYIRSFPNAQLSGNHEWSFILHADFSKAGLLEQYCGMRGLPPHKIIAVGDGLNDITMLDVRLTPHVGCPSDACPEVRAAVGGGGGYVAGRGGPEGTVEVIRHYRARLGF